MKEWETKYKENDDSVLPTDQSTGSETDLANTDDMQVLWEGGGHPTELVARKVQQVLSEKSRI